MKRTLFVAVALSIAVAAIASAQSGPQGVDSSAEIELSGRLRLEADERPVLVVGTEEYTLAIPRSIAAELDVDNGARVLVAGYLSERRSFDLISDSRVLRVRAFEVDGVRVVAAEPHRGSGRSGPRAMAGRTHGDRPGRSGGR